MPRHQDALWQSYGTRHSEAKAIYLDCQALPLACTTLLSLSLGVSSSLAPSPEQTWKHAHLERVIRNGSDGQALEIINNMHRAVQLGHLCSLYQAHTLQIPTHVLAVSQGSSTWVSLVSSSRPSRCGCLRSTRCPAGLPSLSLSASPPPSLAHMQETTRCSSSARCHAAAQDAIQRLFTSEPAAAAADKVALSMKTSRKTFPSCAQGIEVSPCDGA